MISRSTSLKALAIAPLVVAMVILSPGVALAQSIGPTGRPYLGPGSEGLDVRVWQDDLNTWLKEARPDQGMLTVDAVYGPTTQAVTRDFQSDRGIPVDGIVGPDTRAEMHEYLANQGQEDPLLALGDDGTEVVEWQTEVNVWTEAQPHLGPVAVDGVFGPRTEEVTSRLQENVGIPADGIVGPMTRNQHHTFVLQSFFHGEPEESERILGLGDTGPAVAEWQDRLNGWLQLARTEEGRLTVDGIFGPNTEAATMDFQAERGITVDGFVGPVTRAQMAEFESDV